ncbi:ABC transporter ATP-binding protein/permease, partial [Aliarcobacter butzleri]
IILSRLSEPLANFLAVTAVLDIMEAGFRNIKKLLDVKEFEIQKPIQKPKNFDITFDNVSFNYDSNNQKVLQNLSLNIKEN